MGRWGCAPHWLSTFSDFPAALWRVQGGQPQTGLVPSVHLAGVTLALRTFQEGHIYRSAAAELHHLKAHLLKGFLLQPSALSTPAVFGGPALFCLAEGWGNFRLSFEATF